MSHTDQAAPGTSLSGATLQRLDEVMRAGLEADGGWWPFDRFMAAALYTPGLGYYSGPRSPFGLDPADGSDFATAPEMSPLFGQTLARQVNEALVATGTDTVYEFGAGTGALAAQLLAELGPSSAARHYRIIDLSGTLRQRQSHRLAAHRDRVQWLDRLPDEMHGVVVANEVLDAMPVNLLRWDGRQWWERGVVRASSPDRAVGAWAWSDRPTDRRPPVDGEVPSLDEDARMAWASRFAPETVIEVHLQAEAFMRTLAGVLRRGAAFFIDYGFPEREFYHPQRTGGTLMCHRGHRSDTDPLVDVGLKDITAHVNFTGVALAAQEAGLTVLGYTSQARFLFNCGLAERMAQADWAERGRAARLVNEHEMGELFKVLGLAAGEGFEALGFVQGDRSHTL